MTVHAAYPRPDPAECPIANDNGAVTETRWPDPVSVVSRLWLAMADVGSRNIDATLQAVTILGRGGCALDMAWRGLVCMTIEEEVAAARAHTIAGEPRAVLDLEFRLMLLRWSRQVGASVLLLTTALQVLEDASVPLARRTGDVLGDRIATAA